MALTNLLPGESYNRAVLRLRNNDASCLAPKFRERSDAAITEANAKGLNVVSFETCRSNELAELYYDHGVSRAPTALHTWHHYGLARDVISKEHGWDLFPGGHHYKTEPEWWHDLYRIFKSHNLDAGADWVSFKDYPHWQFGGLRSSPLRAISILQTQGLEAVWRAVGADADDPPGMLPGVPS